MNAGTLNRNGVRTRHPVDFYPERCAYGAGSVSFTAGFDTFVLLTNDDPLGRFLRLYSVLTINDGIFQQLSVRVFQGVQGTLAMAGQPLVTSMASMPGSIYTGTTLTEFGTPYGSGAIGFSSQVSHDFPLLVLAPNWSLVCFGGAVGNSVAASFIWMVD